jgi:hypothetical protein
MSTGAPWKPTRNLREGPNNSEPELLPKLPNGVFVGRLLCRKLSNEAGQFPGFSKNVSDEVSDKVSPDARLWERL